MVYLQEMGVTRDRAATGKFVAWITSDVLVEEEAEMARKEIGSVKLKASIKSIAGPWYKRRLVEGSEEAEPDMAAEIMEKMKSAAI